MIQQPGSTPMMRSGAQPRLYVPAVHVAVGTR